MYWSIDYKGKQKRLLWLNLAGDVAVQTGMKKTESLRAAIVTGAKACPVLGETFVGLLLLMLLYGLYGAADAFSAPAIDEYIQGIEQKYGAMQDLSASFEQETYLGSIKRIEKGEGSVCFKKGGKMYWEYKKPSVQKIYLDGKNLWFYLPEDNQVMHNDSSKLPSDITLDLFAGKLKIREKFIVSAVPEEPRHKKNSMVLKLVPRSPQPNLRSLTLWVDGTTYYIYQSSLEDELGNNTTLKFSRIKVDRGLDDAIFTFTPPPGVELFKPPALSPPNPS